MVKVTNPLFSHGASGRMGGIVYQTGMYGAYVKTYTPQRKLPTAKQYQQNYFFGVASDQWRNESQEVKDEYKERASKMKLTGYNLYIKENIQHP